MDDAWSLGVLGALAGAEGVEYRRAAGTADGRRDAPRRSREADDIPWEAGRWASGVRGRLGDFSSSLLVDSRRPRPRTSASGERARPSVRFTTIYLPQEH